MNKETKKRNMANFSLRDNEDMPVIDYIEKINHGQKITMLEVGSGECRFVKKIKNLYPNFDITCIEINPDLAKIAEELDCIVINVNILDVHLKEKYDIVHCSHIIEHFGYPEIAKVFDFLVSVVNSNGRIIVRSPLLWNGFFNDLDHIRPYPPETISNYFNYKQQQKQGQGSISFDSIWYRTAPRQLEFISKQRIIYGIPFLRRPFNWFIRKINNQYAKWWKKYRWPASSPNGYVAIIKYCEPQTK